MAFTREFIRSAAKESGVELPKELEDALVQEHLAARDAFAQGKVKSALEEHSSEENSSVPHVEDTQEYQTLKKEFEDYKSGIAAKEQKAARESAARSWYESQGITGKALGIAMRASGQEIEALELADGKIKDASALEALVKGDFSGLVSQTVTKGADTSTPPANPENSGEENLPNARAAQIAAAYHENLYGKGKE